MPSDHETFWQHDSYAVVGHSARKTFPRLTYNALKKSGKAVYPVDPSREQIEGDRAYGGFDTLPKKVAAAVLELPREETLQWVEKAAAAGVKELWLHMNTETPEALAAAREHHMNVRTGTCAVMYVTPGFSVHAIHRGIRKLLGRY